MSNPSPAEPSSGPSASIAVEYVLGAEDPFKFSLKTASRVTVETDGTIGIAWQKDDPPAQLEFQLTTSPGLSFLDGILVGWRGGDIPIDAPRPLTYSVVAPLTETQAVPHTLIVTLARSQGTLTYWLYVAYPTDEGPQIGVIDPKIYNEGDGGPPPHR